MDFHPILPRTIAKQRGIKRYFTGTKCLNGNVALRKTANFQCTCDKCHAGELGRDKALRAKNRDSRNAYNRKYAAENREILNEKKREKYKENPSIHLQRTREWRRRSGDRLRKYNRVVNRVNFQKRRISVQDRTPVWFGEFDEFVLREASELSLLRCECTGIKWHIDHMIPLKGRTACGLHCGLNIQVIPAAHNFEKNNRMVLTEPGEWVRYLDKVRIWS